MLMCRNVEISASFIRLSILLSCFLSQPNTDTRFSEPTVGKVLLKMRGMFMEEYMYWVCVIALFAFSVLFNLLFILALSYLQRKFPATPWFFPFL